MLELLLTDGEIKTRKKSTGPNPIMLSTAIPRTSDPEE